MKYIVEAMKNFFFEIPLVFATEKVVFTECFIEFFTRERHKKNIIQGKPMFLGYTLIFQQKIRFSFSFNFIFLSHIFLLQPLSSRVATSVKLCYVCYSFKSFKIPFTDKFWCRKAVVFVARYRNRQ